MAQFAAHIDLRTTLYVSGWGQAGGVRGISRARVGDCVPTHAFYGISG